MKVKRDNALNFHHLINVSQKSGCKTFATLLFMLTTVRISRQNQSNLARSSLPHSIDCNKKAHNVVVYA